MTTYTKVNPSGTSINGTITFPNTVNMSDLTFSGKYADPTTSSKQILFDSSSATTGTTTTLRVTGSANRVITFPNASDTMVGQNTSDTLTNKSFTNILSVDNIRFAQTTLNNKITLFGSSSAEHTFYGFGVNGFVLRYQVDALAASHVFYGADVGGTSSTEYGRFSSTGVSALGLTFSGSLQSTMNKYYTSTYSGVWNPPVGGNPSSSSLTFRITRIGNIASIYLPSFSVNIVNATSYTLNIPVSNFGLTDGSTVPLATYSCRVQNSGAIQLNPGLISLSSSPSVLSFLLYSTLTVSAFSPGIGGQSGSLALIITLA